MPVIPNFTALLTLCVLFLTSYVAMAITRRQPIPGPLLHKLTSFPYLFHFYRGTGDKYADKLHRAYGPVVQLAPRQISVNDVAGVRDVFAVSRRLDRPEPLPFFHNYGSENLVSTVDGDVHQDRRKPVRNIFSARVAQSDDVTRVILDSASGMLDLAKSDMKTSSAVQIKPLIKLALYDIMSLVVYGQEHKLNLVRDAEQRKAMQADIDYQDNRELTVAAGFMFLLPQLTIWLRKLGIAPKSINGHSNNDLVSDKLGRKALASLQSSEQEHLDGGHEPLMQRQYAHFRENGPSPGVPSLEYILSDSLDNFWAGVSTTSDGLAPLFRYLSLPEHRERQERLREEIRKATTDAGVSSPFQLSAEQLKQCAYLEGVIRETLRLHPPIPFSMERIVTKREGSINIKGYNVPAGWRVSSQAMYMQRQEEIFGDARSWCPERWVDGDAGMKDGREEIRDMKAHFLAFGAGPRMCLGINIAFSMMRGIVAGVYGTSKTTISEEKDAPPKKKRDEEVGVAEGWMAERNRKVWLRFEDA